MKLKELLLELDTREQKYPGIKPKESVKDYKARMKKQKAAKSDQNKRYRAKKEMMAKSVAWHKKDLEFTSKIVNQLPKERNKWIVPSSVDVNKGSFNVAQEDTAFPITKELAPILKTITPSRGVEVNGVRYWQLDKADYEEAKDALNKEIEDFMKDNMTPEQLESYYESEDLSELDSLLESIID